MSTKACIVDAPEAEERIKVMQDMVKSLSRVTSEGAFEKWTKSFLRELNAPYDSAVPTRDRRVDALIFEAVQAAYRIGGVAFCSALVARITDGRRAGLRDELRNRVLGNFPEESPVLKTEKANDSGSRQVQAKREDTDKKRRPSGEDIRDDTNKRPRVTPPSPASEDLESPSPTEPSSFNRTEETPEIQIIKVVRKKPSKTVRSDTMVLTGHHRCGECRDREIETCEYVPRRSVCGLCKKHHLKCSLTARSSRKAQDNGSGPSTLTSAGESARLTRSARRMLEDGGKAAAPTLQEYETICDTYRVEITAACTRARIQQAIAEFLGRELHRIEDGLPDENNHAADEEDGGGDEGEDRDEYEYEDEDKEDDDCCGEV